MSFLFQAKGGSDQISVVQTKQDIAWCTQRYEGMRCRAISAQFMSDERVAMFELTIQGDAVKVVDERHYKLVAATSRCNSNVGLSQRTNSLSPASGRGTTSGAPR